MCIVINLSQKLEGYRQDADSVLNIFLSDQNSAEKDVTSINAFVEKILEVPDRVWVLLFIVCSPGQTTPFPTPMY